LKTHFARDGRRRLKKENRGKSPNEQNRYPTAAANILDPMHILLPFLWDYTSRAVNKARKREKKLATNCYTVFQTFTN
jgi:hypothetical protein